MLARFESVEETLPPIFAVLHDVLDLRTAIVIVTTATRPSSLSWKPEGDATEPRALDARIRPARKHARAALAYFGGGALPPADADRRLYVTLPLTVHARRAFGVVQLEWDLPPDERDLGFVSEIVRQVAVALDRDGALGAASERLASSERARAVADGKREDAERRVAVFDHDIQSERFIADVGVKLATAIGRNATLVAVTKLVVPYFADACVIDELRDDGSLVRVETPRSEVPRSESSPLVHRALSTANVLQARVVATGEPIAMRDAGASLPVLAKNEADAEMFRASGIVSILVVPLEARGRCMGALTLATAESGRRYSESDVAIARAIALRIALAFDDARLHDGFARAVRDRQDALAMVSHDLRAPLSTVLTTTQLLARRAVHERRGTEDIVAFDLVKRAVFRMARMLDDLLDASSIDAGRLTVRMSPCSLRDVFEDAVTTLKPLAGVRSFIVDATVPEGDTQLLCDRDRILQVLENLVGNALKFSAEGTNVAMRVDVTSTEVRFAIADAGAGIAPSDLSRLFERYWRASKTDALGHGLGLYISRALVEAHGGRIWAESDVGHGSTFFFTLPCATPSQRIRAQS